MTTMLNKGNLMSKSGSCDKQKVPLYLCGSQVKDLCEFLFKSDDKSCFSRWLCTQRTGWMELVVVSECTVETRTKANCSVISLRTCN